MRILVVEDDVRVADFVIRGLQAELHKTEHARDGVTALELAGKSSFDVIVLDLMLPGMHGRDVCRLLRERNDPTPILMLSALDAVEDRVAGLKLGADDYLTKPFDFSELLTRLEVLARRPREIAAPAPRTEFGGILLDRESLEVRRGEAGTKLTVTEFALIEFLLSNPGRISSRERILSKVWGLNEDPLTNIVEVYVARLRKKLAEIKSDVVLENIRGAGYRIRALDQ